MKPDDPIKKAIKCACGKEGCDMGLIINKYPENKIKIQIIDKKDIKTIVISEKELFNALKFREQKDLNYIQIMSLIPKGSIVLDLGCGRGDPFIETCFPTLIGVDIWKKKFKMPEYDEVWFHDIRKILELYPQEFFDVATCIDVIEHLEKKDGFKLMEDMEKIVRDKIIIFTPKKWSENKEAVEDKKFWSYGNKYDYHKSHWTEKDFTDRGYEIIPNKNYILAKKELK